MLNSKIKMKKQHCVHTKQPSSIRGWHAPAQFFRYMKENKKNLCENIGFFFQAPAFGSTVSGGPQM
uniref:Uncharacterized protein n=1 Tax=Anguilla anguilla TaxID=7936 RepID=A0A0E9UXK7_ANGAN